METTGRQQQMQVTPVCRYASEVQFVSSVQLINFITETVYRFVSRTTASWRQLGENTLKQFVKIHMVFLIKNILPYCTLHTLSS